MEEEAEAAGERLSRGGGGLPGPSTAAGWRAPPGRGCMRHRNGEGMVRKTVVKRLDRLREGGTTKKFGKQRDSIPMKRRVNGFKIHQIYNKKAFQDANAQLP